MGYPPPRPYVDRGLVGMRHGVFVGAYLSSGSSQTVTYRLFHPIKDGTWRKAQLCLLNETLTSSGSGTPANTLTIKAAIETATRIVPVYFSGSRTLTLAPFASAVSDPAPVVLSAPGFWERVTVSVDTLGKKWPVFDLPAVAALSEGYITGDHCDDATLTLGVAQCFGSVGVLAVPDINRTSVAIIGSSSAWGQGDTAPAPDYPFGYLARGLTALGYPYQRLAISGDTLAVFVSDWDARRKALLAAQPTHVIFQLGTNDITAGTAEATIKANYLQALDLIDGLGIKVVATTWWSPTTNNNGDGWTTLAGQTHGTYSSVFSDMNAWVKSKPHSAIVGVIDPVPLVADPSDPLKFRVDLGALTPDGTHLNPLGAATAAQSVTF